MKTLKTQSFVDTILTILVHRTSEQVDLARFFFGAVV